MAPIKATGSDSDPTYRYLARLDTEAEDTEASRLLYVAATRAENRLHLLACLGCNKEGELRHPFARSLLANAWPAAEQVFHARRLSPQSDDASSIEAIYSINRISRDFRMPPPSEAVRWAAPAAGREEEEIEFSWAGQTARHIGTVVHRWLQQVAADGIEAWSATRIDALSTQIARQLQRRGIPSSELKPSSQKVSLALKGTLSDVRGRWILQSRSGASSEYRVRIGGGTASQTYVIDRIFTDDDGARWVIDFKTSSHEGSDVDAFLNRERERYAPQLKCYAAAIPNSQQGLYFPLLHGWREDR